MPPLTKEREEAPTVETLHERVTVLEDWKERADDTLLALRRAADHIEVQNSTNLVAIKAAFSSVMADRDDAKTAAGKRRAWAIVAGIVVVGIVVAVGEWQHVPNETLAITVATLAAFVWKAIDRVAPAAPKTSGSGNSIPPPPNANGRSQ